MSPHNMQLVDSQIPKEFVGTGSAGNEIQEANM